MQNLGRYSTQLTWKKFEDRLREVIEDMVNPLQIKCDKVHTASANHERAINKLTG